jgi:anthranilate 1,2-dioxygenase (deaminating, decarboxylating) large subunit
MFTEPELFDLEMEMIFEKNWIYACHESEISQPNDFVTMRAGRQPMIITRDANGQLNALVNACQHRGATLTRVCKGRPPSHLPFPRLDLQADGKLLKVKAPSEYPEGLDRVPQPEEGARSPATRASSSSASTRKAPTPWRTTSATPRSSST